MTLDDMVLADAEKARDRMEAAQDEVERARADYHRAIRRLHASGGTLREIADALGLSHQRVHQVVESGSMIDPSPPARDETALIHCSFCHVSQRATQKLVAGPGVYICEVCVASARALEAGQRSPASRVELTLASSERDRCSFCGKKRAKVEMLAADPAGRVRICNECTDLCVQIIDSTS